MPMHLRCGVSFERVKVDVLTIWPRGRSHEAVDAPGSGLTPLHIACEKGQAAAVVCLLRHGAALDTRDSIGRTPLDWARAKERGGVEEAVGAWRAESGDKPNVGTARVT